MGFEIIVLGGGPVTNVVGLNVDDSCILPYWYSVKRYSYSKG